MATLNDLWNSLTAPKAKPVDYYSKGYDPSYLTGTASGGAKISVPPKAVDNQQVSNYLTQGVSWLNAIGGIVSTIAPKAAQITAPAEALKVGGVVTGAATPGTSAQVNLPDNVIVLPGQVSTQGSQAIQAQDFSWVMWLIIALLVLGGLYIVTKGK
ncbi:MAG: hypothetical protein KKH77_07050 [Candidatus Omnitrophica bacterium]|nr:hypothetical protein [Candidatus Omnitrophota bacterium]MBU1808136.1 hypothetical protein [Candidatus Omnitrophota bacterium]